MRTVVVHVTQEDLALSWTYPQQGDPVERALWRVPTKFLRGTNIKRIRFPEIALHFVRLFQAEDPDIGPFTFDLELPDR